MQPSDGQLDRYGERVLAIAYHVRRYVVLYVVGAMAIAAIGVFPAIHASSPTSSAAGAGPNTGGVNFSAAGAQPAGAADAATAAAASPAAGGATAAGAGATAATPGATGAGQVGGSATHSAAAGAARGAGAAATAGASGAAATTQSGATTVVVGAGTTISGAPCAPNVRQLAFSQYADPCEEHFTGNNGGATFNGVTAKTITLAYRHTQDSTGANAAANQAEAEAAGGVSYDTAEQYAKQFIAYFNKTYELYGRQVQLVDYNGQGNNTNETLGQDQAAACADADQAANTLHAFADMNYEGLFEPDPFSACAARYHLYVPLGSAYYPENVYQSYNPYVWATTTNCTLITDEFAEFTGKDILNYPAQYAGNDGVTSMQGQPRKFALYIPNNAGYQSCGATYVQDLETQYHVPSSRFDQYNYALDISTFPQDAQRGIVQFAANHDTSIVMACDPVSMVFLTQDAVNQQYYPEWLDIGVAADDTDNYGQLWDPAAITGRLFGLSQLGSTQSQLDPNGEVAKAAAAAGVPLNISSVGVYFGLMAMYNQLQAAGPDLTPANIAAGSAKLPPAGSATGPVGTWYFNGSHTLIDDSRYVWWNANGQSTDGKQGTFVQMFGGKRFTKGQFPTGQQPFFQNGA